MLSFFSRKVPEASLDWIGVDIHSHILPALDDGSPDIQTSFFYLRELCQLGLTRFICTPHVFTDLYPNTPETISRSLQNLKDAPGFNDLGVEVCAAAEYMLDNHFKSLLATDKLLFLNDKYVLVEMSYLNETPDIEQHIFDLKIKGLVPVLAHPERYFFYHQQFDRYYRLKEMGCLFQVNMLSASGYYGKPVAQIALRLLKEKLIDLVGTDLHHERHLFALKKILSGGLVSLKKYPFRNRELFS